MIIVKIYTVNPETNKIGVPGTVIDKITNEELDEMSFDYTNPNIWKKIIMKRWPQFITKYRQKIRWSVYRIGGNPPMTNYFPGYDKNGKQLDIMTYGRI